MRKFAVFSSNKTTNRTKHPQNERSGNWRQPVHLHWEISKMTEHRQVNWGKKNKNHQQTQNMFSSSNMKSFLFLCARITSTCTWNRRRQVQTKQLITSQTLLSSRNKLLEREKGKAPVHFRHIRGSDLAAIPNIFPMTSADFKAHNDWSS